MSRRHCIGIHVTVKSVVLLWMLTEIFVIQAQIQDQYIGCFYDIGNQSDVLATDTSMTVEKCIASCQGTQTTYASIRNGTACTCRTDYGVQVSDRYCSFECSENSTEFCGGIFNRRDTQRHLAYAIYSVCAVGMYGVNCDQVCHCEGYIPCDRWTGYCPVGCYGNWNGPACNSTPLSQQYIGCYSDVQGNRALEFWAYGCLLCFNPNYGINTIEVCIQTCANSNYTYAGGQFRDQCFCGDSGYGRYGRNNESLCDMACSGNPNEYCGGANANSVYSVCPVGTYGYLCARRCNCFNNSICMYLNGSCPSSLCSSGWTGSSCNIRDCAVNNGDCKENETCTTIDLSYAFITMCRCSEGFQRINIWEYCSDIDECEENIDTCDPVTTSCSNTIGSYQCICKDGIYQYNGSSCSLTEPGSVSNTGTIVGVVVGSVLGVIAIVAISVAIFFLRRRKEEQRNKKRETATNDLQVSNDTSLHSSDPTDCYSTLGERFQQNDQHYTSLTQIN